MSEKCSNVDGSAQKSSIKNWKWFTQDLVIGGMQGEDSHKQDLFSPALSLELHEELLDSTASWEVHYKEPLTD